MLAMFAGFFIWLTQGLLPCPGGIPLLRLDLRFPALYAVVPQMATLVNPLAMLLIGSTLGESRLGDALRDWLDPKNSARGESPGRTNETARETP